MKDNRKRLIETAQRLFRERGYAGTGIQDILDASGVSRSNLYYHFKSKAALAAAVLAAWRADVEGMLAQASADTVAGYKPAIERICELFIKAQLDDPQTVCPFARMALELGDKEPELTRAVGEVFDAFTRVLADLVRRGVARGEFRPGTDAEALAQAILVAIEGGIVLSRAQGQPRAMQAACRAVIDAA